MPWWATLLLVAALFSVGYWVAGRLNKGTGSRREDDDL